MTVREVRSFFGLCNMFRRFLQICAPVTALHNTKLRNDQLWKFGDLTENELTLLEVLERTNVSASFLTLPR